MRQMLGGPSGVTPRTREHFINTSEFQQAANLGIGFVCPKVNEASRSLKLSIDTNFYPTFCK